MVTIIPYQSKWPDEFRSIAAGLRAGLGDLALRIDHIGSTAVPGLAAKDIIDIQISVAALGPTVQAALEALGYSQMAGVESDHAPPGFSGTTGFGDPDHAADWAKFYFRPPPGQRDTHVHVRVQDRPNQRYPLLFRDYLRAHPLSVAAYAELKRRLAEQLADSDMYPEVKDPAVDLIYLAAEEWARAKGWQPGPSDA